MTTVNMAIAYPTPAVTAGPQWASLINAAFDTVDAHDHTTGKGVAVPTAGLNINADLTLNSKNLFGIRSLRLDNQAATLATASDLRILYAKNGELAYRDAAGNEVVLTAAGSVAGATGTITGLSSPASASFNSITGTYSFLKDTSKPGKFVTADLLLYEYNNASANSVTLKSPASLASSYTVTMPAAVPTQTLPVSMNTSGVLSLGWADGSVSAPAAAFATEPATGLYRPGAAQLAVTINGTQNSLWTAAGLAVTGTLSTTGVASPASLTVAGATSLQATTTTTLTATAVNAASVTTTGAIAAGTGLSGTTLGISSTATILGALSVGSLGSSGTITAPALNLSSGGAFKAKIFTGTLAATATATFTVSGTVVGMFGRVFDSSNGWEAISDNFYGGGTSNGSTAWEQNTSGSSSSTVSMTNTSATHTKTYSVMVIFT